jgi:dynein heavy chain 2
MTLWVKNLCRYDLAAEDLLDVVAHEANRIFNDRLVGSDARNRFEQIVSGILRSQFRHNLTNRDSYFTSLTSARGGGASGGGGGEGKEGEGTQNIVGGMIRRMSEEDFKKLVAQGVMYYEREDRDLNMLLVPEILENVAIVDRILSGYSGHMLLVGKCGVGRRNAATIASYMFGYEFQTPAISRDYGSKQFIADVKNALLVAGIRGEHVCFLIEDFQIVTESILEIINSLLSAGEVPGMYTHEELEPLLSPLREKMREEGTFRTPYEFFVSRVKKYLHIVLCMDPDHPKFLFRCESNPALYAQCAVVWMGEWKINTLKLVPRLMEGIKDLVTVDEDEGDGDEEKNPGKRGESKGESKRSRESDRKVTTKSNGMNGEALIEMIIAIHSSCTTLKASPRDYISFLNMWHSLFNMKRLELVRDVGHLEAGLGKLESAAVIVNDLRTNAAQQERDLKTAQAAADRAMEEISKALTNSTERRNEVADVKRTVAENEQKTRERKREIESELAEIQPVLDSAKQAVGSIKPEHLNEIRSLTAPPEAIADVLSAVLMMLGVQDLTWSSMKKFLGNRGVKDDILNFDASRISNELRKNVAKLIKKKSASFESANIQRVSVAAAPMAAWVKANIKYSLVIEKIEPLQAELEEEIVKLERSQRRLERCEEELKDIDDRVSNLKKEFASRTAEAERLKGNLAIAGSTLDKAEGLIGQLGGEQKRWRSQANQLNEDLGKLPMKMLLAAGFATYLAKAPEDVRASMISHWIDIVGIGGGSGPNSGFAFKRVMSTESELLQWKSMGLPSDDLSQENGLVIMNAADRVPLIIDPASAATEWLRSILSNDKSRPLEVITQHDSRFANQVELAVRFGKTLVILEVDGVEPMLYPLCRKDLAHQGPRYVVNVGDKTVDYNENFRLYLVTRNPEPDIAPDAESLVTQINFTVTRSGLEGQLLGLAIQHEQPELEKAKGEMLKKEEDFKVQLAALEKDLLQALATAEGNLLENASLIESLTRTKEKSAEIEDALQKSADASIKLDQQRDVYRSFAIAGSKLFFLVKTLQSISNMYKFSLGSFIVLFRQTLAEKNSSSSTEDRLRNLCSNLEVRVLHFFGRALFKADRLMFALHLIRGMHSDHFQPKEWEIFTGTLVSSVTDGIPKGYPNWAPAERQSAYRLVLENIPHLVHGLELENMTKWNRFSSSLEAEKDLPPLKGVTPFQRVLIIQMLRPDRLHSALVQFCTDMLRIESISPPPLSLAGLYAESEPTTPLLLISSPGSDASKELQEFAEKTVGAGNYEELAMGGGQQEVAMHLLRSAASAGTWLCLKNLHLVVAWLPNLEKELSSLEAHPEFRLWLTSETHPQFPSILLQQSLKATYESPPGIKKNLQRTFDSWEMDTFNDSSKVGAVKSRLLFLLSVFHAVIQERRTFIPQGWTKFYEFSYGDIRAGTFMMEAMASEMKERGGIDWEAIHGLMDDAIYGGRIDNVYDNRVLRSYLTMFFNDMLASDDAGGTEVLVGTALRMPKSTDYDAFKKIIENIPDIDSPFIFGLPDNIERSLQRATSSNVIKLLRALSVSAAEVTKFDREKWREKLGPVLELWQTLSSSSPGLIGRKVDKRVTAGGHNETAASGGKKQHDPVDDFVTMQYELAGDICGMVDGTMNALKKVLFGTGLLTPQIQSVAKSLLGDTIPNEWFKTWDCGPEKPQTWLQEIVRKRIALGKWKAQSGRGNLLTSSEALNLDDLFHPATFINALRQQTARTIGCAIDKVKMVSSWPSPKDKDFRAIKGVCPIPCILSSLFLQGASFMNTLQESAPDAMELTPAPSVCIGFVPMDTNENSIMNSNATIGIPVFLSTTREDFLMEIQMPINNEELKSRWILAGTALFLRAND